MTHKPFPFQYKVMRCVSKFGGSALVSMDMGLGKTPTSLWYTDNTDGAYPLLVVCPAGLKGNWEREVWKFLRKRAHVLEGMRPPAHFYTKSDIVVVNYDILSAWLDVLKAYGFGTVVFDEAHYCFPGETMVATEYGPRRIDELVNTRETIRVWSFNLSSNALELKNVCGWVRLQRRNELVKVKHSFGQIICTEDHKIYTDKGWKEAKHLQQADKIIFYDTKNGQQDLSVVQRHVPISQQWPSQQQKETFLWEQLRCEMADLAAIPCPTNPEYDQSWYSCSNWKKASGCFTENEAQQPSTYAGGHRQNSQGAFGQNIPSQGRQWEINSAANYHNEINWADSRISNFNQESQSIFSQFADVLQGGFGTCCYENSRGNRWGQPQFQKATIFGPSQNSCIKFSWVDCVEIYESGSQYGTRSSSREDRTVYCLSVEENENFFADGVLVANCKNRRSQRTKAAKKLARVVQNKLLLTGTPITNRHAELWPLLNILAPKEFNSFFTYALKFCLPADAPILMADFTEKPIAQIKIGDKVIGWGRPGKQRRRLVAAKVLDIIHKRSPLQKVFLSNGQEVICTPDHLWATGYSHKGHQYARFRSPGSKRGDGGTLCCMPILSHIANESIQSDDYRRGYLIGLFRGDGHCVRHGGTKFHLFKNKCFICNPKYSIGCGCMDHEPIDRASEFLTYFGINHSKRHCNDGLWRIEGVSRKEVYDFLAQCDKRRNNDWWAGFLGGIYDAEGSGRTIAQIEAVNPVTFSMIDKGLRRFNFDTYIASTRRTVTWRGGRDEFVRFWNVARPSIRRKLITLLMSAGGRWNAGGVGASIKSKAPQVTSIQPLTGEHDVWTLTTTTGNYVAYGLGSKNCGPQRRPWGWEYKRSTNAEELHALLTSKYMIRVKKEDVLTDLPPKVRRVVRMSLSDAARKEYGKAFADFLSWLRRQSLSKARKAARAKSLGKTNALRRLAAQLKIKAVFEWIDNFLEESDGKICLFAYHRSILNALEERYGDLCVRIDGNTPKKTRADLVDNFNKSKKKRIFIGQVDAAGVGLNITGAHTVAFIEMCWTPAQHSQAEDRCYGRMSDLHGATCYYLVADDTIEVEIVKLLHRKQKVSDAAIDGIFGAEEASVFNELLEQLHSKAGEAA